MLLPSRVTGEGLPWIASAFYRNAEAIQVFVVVESDMPRFLPVPTVELPLDQCVLFATSVVRELGPVQSLDFLRVPDVFCRCMNLSQGLLDIFEGGAREALGDPLLGIFTLDIPGGIDPDPNRDALFGAIIAAALMGRMFEPVYDPASQTPFTVYNASPDNEKRLRQAGLHFFASGEKVGFHTDGSIDERTVSVPEYIGLYNLLINYQKPGNLYWLPFSLWEEFDAYAERFGWAVPYRIELTPAVYSNADETIIFATRSVQAPIFSRSNERQAIVFFNGRIVGRERFNGQDIDQLVAEMGQSISLNPVRYCIPQRQRRLVFARNTCGFHARDMLEKPYHGCKYTRSFIRAVSASGAQVGLC